MASTAKNMVLGLVFLGSLAVLGAATLMVSSVSFLKDAFAVPVRFADVDNLQTGDAVVIHGCRVGQVNAIRYQPDVNPTAPILVECTVDAEIGPRLEKGTTFTIRSSGPLGGRYLEIATPVPQAVVPVPEGVFVGSAPGDLFKQLAELVRTNEKNITGLLENFHQAVAEVKETFRAANAGEGTLGLFLRDEDTRERAYNFITDASATMEQIREDVTSDKGIVSYLLRDENAKESLMATLEKLNQVVADLGEGEGILSRMIHDQELADRVAEIVDDFHDVVHKVNSGQGTLGQVVNNPKAWDELVRILVLARETIEDIREQAPVSTFVNAAFAAF